MTSPIFHILTSFLNLTSISTWPIAHEGNSYGSHNVSCHTIYGHNYCFSLDYPWVSSVDRVAVEPPWSPSMLDTTFTLFTKDNYTYPTILDPNKITELLKAPYKEGAPWKIVIHGFKSGADRQWVKNLYRELLIFSDCNVILVDWNKAAIGPYVQAIANIRIIGVQLAYLIYYLHKYVDVDMSLFHVIGHSLGAHTAGYAGAHLKDYFQVTLPRITALDPAYPFFDVSNPPIVRLDPTDAAFVDVIHTDNNYYFGLPFTLGLENAVGHLDFFPNNAKNQPGCSSDDASCDHRYATKLFIESIRQSCSYIGVACKSYEDFINGSCWGCGESVECIEMGMWAHPSKSKIPYNFYLMTRDVTPHCGYHYRITIEISNTNSSRQHNGQYAIISVALKGANDIITAKQLSKRTIHYIAGSTHNHVILGGYLGSLIDVTVKFIYPNSYLSPLNWISSTPKLHIAAVKIQELTRKESWHYCIDQDYLINDEEVILTEYDIC